MKLSNRRIAAMVGRTPDALIAALEQVKASRLDLLASQGRLRFAQVVPPQGGKPELALEVWRDTDDGGVLRFFPTDYALAQLAEKMGIPGKYFQRCGEELPELLLQNVNGWLQREPEATRLLRGVKQEQGLALRALLSDRYRILDNEDLALTALEAAQDAMQAAGQPAPQVFGWEISERTMDLLICAPGLTADLKAGEGGERSQAAEGQGDGSHNFLAPDKGGPDTVFAAVRVRNSETGGGGSQVLPSAMRRVCSNRLMLGTDLAQIHLGRTLSEELVLSGETRREENRLVFSKIRDAVRATFTPERFAQLVEAIRSTRKVLVVKPADATTVLCEREGFSESRRDSILAAYKREVRADADTLFDLTQALTQAAHAERAENPDGAFELEQAAARLFQHAPPAALLATAGR